ncbi:MAG: AAA family ATPase [Candidatus Aminicenantes bacterium]|nr:AAA family ATPase [Candidatus Aminicenantes bacterium]
MKIETIEINNYKTFHGTHTIQVKGKNLFIYGENGSGKSSLFYALKDFFQSSVEAIDLNEVENIFIKDNQKGKCYIKVTFDPNSNGEEKKQVFELSTTAKNTGSGTETSIRDANKLKSFLTYKNLLNIHHIKKDQEIDLFDLLVKGVLKHFKYSLTGGKELGQLWEEVETAIARQTGRSYPMKRKKEEADAALKTFNDAFGELFNESSNEYILKHTKPILDQFKHHIDLRLFYRQARPTPDYRFVEDNHVHVELRYAGKTVQKPHLFLNEARLSALAISIYLGMIKRHIQSIPCKILFLDDIFIGLDMANRLPLLEILKTDFNDYQVFLTTYDKPWYEYAKNYLQNVEGWMAFEFYTKETKEGFEIPGIKDEQQFIERAKWHLVNSDYKAAAVYTRSAFEKALYDYCVKTKKEIPFQLKLNDYSTRNFWDAVKGAIGVGIKDKIEQYQTLVLNPFSHYDPEKHEFRTELEGAIKTVEELKKELKRLSPDKK